MRSYTGAIFNKRSGRKAAAAAAALALLLASLAFCAAGAYAGQYLSVKIPYIHIYDADDNRTNDSFIYKVMPQGSAPAPEGSRDGIYYFEITGVPGSDPVTGELDLSISYESAGEYSYEVSAVPGDEDGFTYEDRVYKVTVYVTGDGSGLKASMITALGDDGRKVGMLQLNPGHESEVIPPDEVRPTTTPTGDGDTPDDGINSDDGTPADPDDDGNPGGGDNGGGNPDGVTGGDGDGTPAEDAAAEDDGGITSILPDSMVPKASPDRTYWSLVNLIAAIFSLLISAVMMWRYWERVDTEEDEYIIRRKGALRLAGLIPAISSVYIFLCTEDMSRPMGLTDEWTGVMMGLLVTAAVIAGIAYMVYDRRDEAGSANM